MIQERESMQGQGQGQGQGQIFIVQIFVDGMCMLVRLEQALVTDNCSTGKSLQSIHYSTCSYKYYFCCCYFC